MKPQLLPKVAKRLKPGKRMAILIAKKIGGRVVIAAMRPHVNQSKNDRACFAFLDPKIRVVRVCIIF